MRLLQTVSLLACWPLGISAQTSAAKPAFETASIKMTEATGGGTHSEEHDTPGMLRASMTLKHYIEAAYDVKHYQVTGGPPWMDESTYAIVARLEGSEPAHDRGNSVHMALQQLLAERFQLKIHHESKEMPSYVLALAKGGFKIKEPATGQGCGSSSNSNGVRVKFEAKGCTMDDFAGYLARRLSQPVANRTGVEGRYDFTMEWTPDDLRSTSSDDALPSIFTVLQEKLGLKLENSKAPVDIIVVDSAERPSEN